MVSGELALRLCCGTDRERRPPGRLESIPVLAVTIKRELCHSQARSASHSL
jgi:hypothetical protein